MIKLLAFWEGEVNSTDIVKQFGFTNKRGKEYLSQYREFYPDNLIYNPSIKKFQPNAQFQTYYINQDVAEYLGWLNHVSTENLPTDSHLTDTSTRLPIRQVSPQTMRALVYVIKHQQAIETQYTSLNHPTGEPRIIHPHTFVKTGLCWHLRGYSEKHQGINEYERFISI